MRRGRTITLGEAARHPGARVRVLCLSPLRAPRPDSISRLCWHMAEIPAPDAVAQWGADRSLGDLPLACVACGGRIHDATIAWPPVQPPALR